MGIKGHVTHTMYENDPFSIREFRADEPVELPNGKTAQYFHIKGEYLPATYIDIEIEGEFDSKPFVNKDGRKSFTFNIDSLQETKTLEQAAIIQYLKSLKGIGDRTAHRIYQKFGESTFDVLDNDIDRLLEIEGIGHSKLAVISADYLARGAARELFIYLNQFSVPKSRIQKIFRRYKADAVEKASQHPYILYLAGDLPFETAERISRKSDLDPLSDERIRACIVEALKQGETRGDTNLTYDNLQIQTEKLLDVDKKSKYIREKVAVRIMDNIVALYQVKPPYIVRKQIDGENHFYRRLTYKAEFIAAREIKRLASKTTDLDYMPDILAAEKKLGITLSDEQRSAVQTALNSSLSIVTGGPGTGKTSFQKVLFEVFKKNNPGKEIALAAPTGKAATRMTESSGLPAKTIHQMLHLIVTDDEREQKPTPVTAGLLVVDEMSMVDIFVAEKLFSSIQPGTRVVCVGDAFQLPSVGCGEVLQDMINSGAIPVTMFTKVFRQADGSLIASNAAEINHGGTELEYGEAFRFWEVPEKKSDREWQSQEIARMARRYYKKSLEKYGSDETILLTPYRKSTVTGVNELNPVLKSLTNPEKKIDDKDALRKEKIDGMNIYKGDKIMFTKNAYFGETLLSNGDTGYVKDIRIVDNIQVVTIDLKDGRIVDLMGEDLKSLVLAYATTVHKSQGSEYKCCIIVVDPKHSILLRRNLIYTAVTRAKEKVVLIGDKQALKDSILTMDTGTRNSLLCRLLKA